MSACPATRPVALALALALVLLAATGAAKAAPQEPGPPAGAGASEGRRPPTAPVAAPSSWAPSSTPAAPAPAPAGRPSFDAEWEPREEWQRRGQLQLQRTLARIRQREELARRDRRTTEPGMARNVILFVGDGMGVATTTAAGILVGGEGHLLAWERFPYIGLSKTYSVDHQVPDSAATATAMLTGVKTHSRMLGLDARANTSTCDSEVNREAKLASLALWAQEAGKATGVVTTARITHATPAAAYASINHRDWECDSEMPAESRGCVLDIARQLAEAAPGKDLRVVLGGGRRQLGASGLEDPDEDDSCVREDKRNITVQWKALPGKREYVSTRAQLMDPELLNRADHILGLFAGGNMAYEAERLASPGDQPSLSEMTRVALRALRRHGRDKGFFLLVEGARIDMAHHKNYARLALLEAQQLDEAVHVALDEVDIEDTLIVVTGDHSHAMTINGYPERGSDILGISYAEKKRYDENAVKYETLTYATGPGAKDHQGVRVEDIPEEKRQELRYRHEAGKYTGEDETHAGEDVPVYAAGPGSDLLVGVYEQSFIGTAMAYAAAVGPFKGQGPHAQQSRSGVDPTVAPAAAVVATLVTAVVARLFS